MLLSMEYIKYLNSYIKTVKGQNYECLVLKPGSIAYWMCDLEK